VTSEVAAAHALDKRAIGRLISLFEDPRPEAAARRRPVLEALAAAPHREALVVGVTGAPGSGKSTLIGRLATALVAAEPDAAVAVLAVDPSSAVSGGALLGDRTRVKFPPDEPRLFFRSQATQGELGGIGRATFQVCRLMRLLFDYLFVETVGVGQSEIEIARLADVTWLVLPPLAGDQVQFLKAGIMEVPDRFLLSKCDVGEAAERSHAALRAAVQMARGDVPVQRTSARTGDGVTELVAALRAGRGGRRPWADREAYFLEAWVRGEYGRAGLDLLAARPAGEWLKTAGSFEDAQIAIAAAAAQ
jgi:LAO/AO transport system kinase